ncbi:helix-turn-helix domain-containing protein [Erwinia pyrifoliae]|uniref:helix-turn-helix domain-containing protein n=1 Tax=Erwinia pyrifoliae TaxID=79967 RepID=UPI0001960F50|nr:helix-turn-helix transcriptional regulator [Erwinia pyrifoliae]AUX72459.1 XRE family transcriptional regulator [Erwinia pyrifoliae]MCA8877290.1 helix-turn-helix transcriptional regulator [Erwinia pyrifoliae]CAX55855.1 Repressor protein CI [Erwinia pyrifoliae Ep1/96]
MKKLSERLHDAMQKTGLSSQSELAKLAGVNQSIISKILSGKNETSKYSGRLAAALGISADWLINGAGAMEGGEGPLQRIDTSRLVSVWDETGKTADVVSWHDSVPDYFRVYLMKKNTGIDKAPEGALILVDPKISAGNNQLVVTNLRGIIAAYRFLEGGAKYGFLDVDDPRIPPFEITDPSCIEGVAEQILIRKLR